MDLSPAVLTIVLQACHIRAEERCELASAPRALAFVTHLVIKNVRLDLNLEERRKGLNFEVKDPEHVFFVVEIFVNLIWKKETRKRIRFTIKVLWSNRWENKFIFYYFMEINIVETVIWKKGKREVRIEFNTFQVDWKYWDQTFLPGGTLICSWAHIVCFGYLL